MKYLCFVLYLQISFKECTIDINIKELVYIADHLTTAECRRLFASLYFVSYELPPTLPKATQQIPKNIPCIKLLVKWNSGIERWEGQGKSHAIVERRLRQLKRNDLADWLGKVVFHHLAKEVNNSLEDEPSVPESKAEILPKVYKEGSRLDVEQWTTFDSVLSVTLFGLLFVTLAAFCRMLKLTFRRVKLKRNNSKNAEELMDLMSADTVDSDQETVYELDVENRRRSRVSFEEDLKNASSEECDK